MGPVVASVGQVLFYVGICMAIIIQIYAFVRIVKTSAVNAVLALFLYGYVLYYIWRSENKMPRVFRAYLLSVACFLIGMVFISVGVEM